MKYIDFIKYLINAEQLVEIYQELEVSNDSEGLLIYMKDALDLESEIIIIEIEETEGDLLFKKGGTNYIQLFPIEYAVNLIESDLNLKGKGYSDLEIATRLLEYRINDA